MIKDPVSTLGASFVEKERAMAKVSKPEIAKNVIKLNIIDPVFFSKDQLKVGSILKYYGRHAPGTTWEVTKIWYFTKVKGQYRSHRNQTVTKLDDAIEVVCQDDGTIMELTFQYLSYSAIWRLV